MRGAAGRGAGPGVARDERRPASGSATGADASPAINRSMAVRKAARVLPLPVGARSRTFSPVRMWRQASACGGVGVPKRARK